MGLFDWLKESRRRISDEGVAGVRESVYQLWIGLLRRASVFYSSGENIYEKEWDILIILDACRADAIHEISDQYAFLDDPDTIRSVGSATYEWIPRTFTDTHSESISETTYVSANPHIERFPDTPDFNRIVKVWEKQTDRKTGTVPPRAVPTTQ